MSKPLSDNFKLPSIFQDISDPNLKRVKEILERLSLNPPQVLLFDGGTEEKRRSLAFYWAACNLCRNFNNGPCLTCPDCLQVADLAHRDLLAFDGFISNSEDEDNPGFFRAFNADNARNLKIALRDAPHGKHRVVFFTGIAGSRPEAPNALLKVLEEPQPHTLFVLLVPQRSQILPTLVSRALCLTIPWPDEFNTESETIRELTTSLADFLQNRPQFLTKLSGKEALPVQLAQELLVACQKACIRVLAKACETPLDQALSLLSEVKILQFINWIKEAQDMIRNPSLAVTPTRVIAALAMQLYVLRQS